MTYFIESIDYKRDCGSCSMCCQGWLSGDIFEYKMEPNNPCHFVNEGCAGGCCTIYEHRPDMCINYKCLWLDQPIALPLWMRPDKSKVIITERQIQDSITLEQYSYWQVKECGEKIDSVVLNWILRNSMHFNMNLQYEIGGQWYYLGSENFMDMMTARKSYSIQDEDIKQAEDTQENIDKD